MYFLVFSLMKDIYGSNGDSLLMKKTTYLIILVRGSFYGNNRGTLMANNLTELINYWKWSRVHCPKISVIFLTDDYLAAGSQLLITKTFIAENKRPEP
jgi:hypothetical protein